MIGAFFDMLKMRSFINKISRFTGSNPNNPTIADTLLYTIFLFSHRIKKQSVLFKNKYVCADAAIISMAYALYRTASFPDSDKITEELMYKCTLAIRDFYKVPASDLSQILDNHLDYFSDLIFELEDMNDYSLIAKEAALLFTYDLTYNKYVEFKNDTPVLIIGLDKQFIIERETNSYFNVIIPMINEIICKKGL